MADGGALINFGELSKPATVLIEKISDALGGIAKPWQIERVARAEAKADMIRAEARVQISEIEERALIRMVREEGHKQENIENITAKAIPKLEPDAKPENVEKDWLTHFFDRSRLTSDEEMQSLWANILAGEANAPGKFSKRTVEFVSTLDKRDAEIFTKFCTFCWMIGYVTPLIFDNNNRIYNDMGINFETLSHLDSIGLVSFDAIGTFIRSDFPKFIHVFYYGTPVTIEFPADKNTLQLGKVTMTRIGMELAPIAGATRSNEYFQHVLEKWGRENYILSSPVAMRK